MDLKVTLGRIKELQDQMAAAEAEIKPLKEAVLIEMKAKGLENIDARESLGITVTKAMRVKYHYNEEKVREILLDRFTEVLSLDKVKADKFESLKIAMEIDSTTDYIMINKAKNDANKNT
jgi:hypothetical protein